jgi:hypothetical protein
MDPTPDIAAALLAIAKAIDKHAASVDRLAARLPEQQPKRPSGGAHERDPSTPPTKRAEKPGSPPIGITLPDGRRVDLRDYDRDDWISRMVAGALFPPKPSTAPEAER